MSTSKRTLTLTSVDDVPFSAPLSFARHSLTIANWLEEKDLEKEEELIFNVPHTTSYILSKVVEYVGDHSDDEPGTEEQSKKDKKWDDIENNELLQLTMAADILQIEKLLTLTSQIMASRMAGKSPEEIRAMFEPDDIYDEDDGDNDEEENSYGDIGKANT